MGRVTVTVQIASTVDRVWRAITVPGEVEVWDGVTPRDVPEDYPLAGQYARWWTKVGPIRLTLHDRVQEVQLSTRLASAIDLSFVHVEEEYRLEPHGEGTQLISDNQVRAKMPGLGWLAVRLTQTNVEDSMRRLKGFCEQWRE